MTENADSRDEALEKSFIRLLIEDVLASRVRLTADDTQQNRRDTIRSTFAAIEGIAWLYREHVREIAKDMGVLTPIADMALRERTFSVSEQGNVIEQVRFVTLPTIIRLTTKQVQLIEPAVGIDFTDPGWNKLKSAIEVRNAVTHPKSQADLHVDAGDLDVVAAGLAWLLASTESVLTAINRSYRSYEQDFRAIADALQRGDDRAIAAYRDAIIRDEND